MTAQRPRLGSGRVFLALGVSLTLSLGAGCPQLFPTDNSNTNDNTDGNTNGNTNTNTNTNDNVNDGGRGDSGVAGVFIGSERCSLCHARTHASWAETLHARAYETLEEIGQAENAACVGCHTVGFGETGGWVDRATTNSLAGVGCEACHGGAREHAENASDATLRPTIDISAEVCGRCHTGAHHPNYDDWLTTGHANVTESPAEDFFEGSALNNCGKCHSGDYFYRALIKGETLADDALAGTPPEELHAVECAICHNPHQKTGNAPTPEDGRDYQLRFPEVASPTPTNTIDAVTNPARFNLCGQCHHDRGRTWLETSRAPHHSNQSNVFAGEMPLPEDSDILVFSAVSVHSFAKEQCATCHLYRQDFESEEAPAISGHTFQVNTLSCTTSGCHPSSAQADAARATLQGSVQARLDAIRTRLGDPTTWEYRTAGGPDADGQKLLSDEIKQIRFLYYYVANDGSLGIHNPTYVKSILEKAEDLLTSIGR